MSAQAVFCERGFLTALTFSVVLIRVPAFSHPPLPWGAYNVVSISTFAVKCEGETGGEMVDRWKGGGIEWVLGFPPSSNLVPVVCG
jgi:hypothetical protein